MVLYTETFKEVTSPSLRKDVASPLHLEGPNEGRVESIRKSETVKLLSKSKVI